MEIELFKGSNSFIAELQIDPDTGEIGGEFSLDVLTQRNPIGTAAYVLQTLATADMIDSHIKIMQAKKKALTNNAERAKESLRQVMQVTGVLKVESLDRTFKAVLSKDRDKSVEVFDENQIPADYMREVPATYAPDKSLIAKAMKDGFDVPGCRIIAKDRITIS